MVEKQNETTTNKRTIIFAIIVGFALRTLALFDEEAHLLFDVKLREEEEAKTLDDVLKVNIYSTNNNSRVRAKVRGAVITRFRDGEFRTKREEPRKSKIW